MISNSSERGISDFIKCEVNLESMGFFTPSSRISNKILTKKVVITRGNIRRTINISSPPEYGLPTTYHFDIYRAFQKILHIKFLDEGRIVNPISFTTNFLLTLMDKENQRGMNSYGDVKKWLELMVATTIKSEASIYVAEKKDWLTDVFHVFDRAIIRGGQLDGGEIATKNYVWLSDWYLKNMNLNYFKNIDFGYHKALRRPLSKSLYALLDIGFYAANGSNLKKKYDDLADFFSIKKYPSLSLIKKQLEPAHEELRDKGGFLSKWEYEPCKSGTGYNILWYPGQKFFSDQKARLDKKQMALDFTPHQIEQGEETIDLVGYFQRKMNNINNHIPKKKETSRARELLEKCNGDKEKAFWIVDYAVKEMQKTKFQAQHFGAVDAYVDKALLAFDKSKIREQEQQAANKREFEKKKKEYKLWLSQTPEQRVKHRVEFWLQGLKGLKKPEPSEAEIEEKREEYILQLPSPEEKQRQLFNKVIFSIK
jgi:hypothetical protein